MLKSEYPVLLLRLAKQCQLEGCLLIYPVYRWLILGRGTMDEQYATGEPVTVIGVAVFFVLEFMGCQWFFSWIFKIAFPVLHPGTACLRIQTLTSGADRQEVIAIDSTVGKGKDKEKHIQMLGAAHVLGINLIAI